MSRAICQFGFAHPGRGIILLNSGPTSKAVGMEGAVRESALVAFGVLQDRWNLSRRYVVSVTPIAFLIGKDGVIGRNVAEGLPDKTLELAHEAAFGGKEGSHGRAL